MAAVWLASGCCGVGLLSGNRAFVAPALSTHTPLCSRFHPPRYHRHTPQSLTPSSHFHTSFMFVDLCMLLPPTTPRSHSSIFPCFVLLARARLWFLSSLPPRLRRRCVCLCVVSPSPLHPRAIPTHTNCTVSMTETNASSRNLSLKVAFTQKLFRDKSPEEI